MAQVMAGPYNGFIPSATGQVISYIRDPKEFALNEYVQYLKTPKTIGVYAVVDRDQPRRVVNDTDFDWADGDPRPDGDWNQMRFEWKEFSVKRRDYPFRIGNIALEMAEQSWKVREQHIGMVAQQAMTNRTKRVITMLETASNWGANAVDANTLNGGAGTWDQASDDPGSPHYLAIKKSLLEAAKRINLATMANVRVKDLVLVISPGLAQSMANTSEIHNYVKYGPFSKEQLEGPNNWNADHGLPPKLYNFKLTVEDASIVTTRSPEDASAATPVFIKSDTSAILCSRKGGINGNYGAPSFSTIQMYFFQWEMAAYMFEDARNERVDGHMVDCFSELIPAPEAGMLLQNVK